MNKLKTLLPSMLLSINFFMYSVLSTVNAAGLEAYGDEPARLRGLEGVFVNTLIAIWVLSIPYFIFTVASIGARWMTSMGDEGKLSQLKQRGGNVIISFALVFGGYIVVRLIMSLLGLQDPNKCFSSPMGDNAMFKFFFPGVCSGK